MGVRIVIVGGLSALLGACASTGVQTITSEPQGATVRIMGFGECQTPCTVKVDRPRVFSIARVGYKPQSLEVAPGKDIHVIMELAAPTDDVDSAPLPDLE